MQNREPLTKEEAARRLPAVVALLASWTNGNRQEATEDVCDLAIMTVEMLEESMISGTPCMSLLEAPDLSFAASARANGFEVVPLPT